MSDFVDKSLKNEEPTNIIKTINLDKGNEQSLNEFLEIFLKKIDLKTASNNFINNFLNNNFKNINLSELLGNKFLTLYQKFFESFKSQDDLLTIKKWKISKKVDMEILRICTEKIGSILNDEQKTNKTGKINLYKSLKLFLCNLFTNYSERLNNIKGIVDNIEKNFQRPILVDSYYIILLLGRAVFPITETFEEHIKEYINAGKGPLSVWYKLILFDKKDKTSFLKNNLKPEYKVINKDFVGYPLRTNERLSLFIYLATDKEFQYFKNNYIIKTEYYQESIKSCTKEELLKLSFSEGMEIYNNIYAFRELFKLFVDIKQNNDYDYDFDINFAYICDALEGFKFQFDILNNTISFFNQFYPDSKREEIKLLKSYKNKLMALPLNKFNEKIKEIKDFQEYQKEVNKYKKLNNSIIFMEIYESSYPFFSQPEQEEDHFDFSIEKFEELKKLEDYSNIKALNGNFLNIIINVVKNIRNRNRLINELYFIKDFFDIKRDSEKFDVEKICLDLEGLIPHNEKKKKKKKI